MLRAYHCFYFFLLIIFVFATSSATAQTKVYAPWPEENKVHKTTSKTTPKLRKHKVTSQESENITQREIRDKTEDKLSTIEALYAQRLIDEPKQFGYDIFDSIDVSQHTTPMGAVQDDYVLGTGDTLTVTFTGNRTDSTEYKIDAHGMLQINEFPPILAAGQTLEKARQAINVHLETLHNTKAYISLSSIRHANILVVGNVKYPGRKTLNVFHSVLDALSLAGGVNKDGSLRRIKLVRNGRSTHIDLYALLMHGAPHVDIRIKDGDRLIIPPIGPTLAVSGAVKRPAIYEIKQNFKGHLSHIRPESEKLNLNTVLGFAGGTLAPGENRFVKLSLTSDGRETVTEINDPLTPTFTSGTILSVIRSNEKRSGTIELIGHTRRPGLYDVSRYKTLSSILQNDHALDDDIYPLIGVIERYNKTHFSTEYISFPLRLVLNNEFDLSVQDDDVIKLFSNQDIKRLYEEIRIETDGDEITEEGSRFSDIKIIDDTALKSFLIERSVTLRGAVRKPGSYPISDGITLENIIAVAGGMTLDADQEKIEITSLYQNESTYPTSGEQKKRTTINIRNTSPAYITVNAGDSIRVNQKFNAIAENSVLIIGEIKHAGDYDLLPGDKVSDIIKRAGGLTEQAYPAGSIFSRESERKAEELRFRNAAHNMKRRLAAAVENEDDTPNSQQIEMVMALADELDTVEAVGRITVETNPAILETTPELDMYLEQGDRIYIPKRPLTVRVNGEALSPANLQFRKDKSPLDYIHEAGGFTYHADKDRTFVLFPDGSAQPLQVNTWNHRPIFIPPGSTIIIPRDPEPFDFIESASEIGQILGNLAITSVFIDDIRD